MGYKHVVEFNKKEILPTTEVLPTVIKATRQSASNGWIERKSTWAKELRLLEDVHDDLPKIKVKWNREEWRQILKEGKIHSEL
jgi:hypothetical protein